MFCILHVASATTGNDGTATLTLYEDFLYRITFVNVISGINKEITLYPRDNYYNIYIDDFSYIEDNITVREDIDWYWTQEEINQTAAWINFTYVDLAAQTTFIEYWINKSNTGFNLIFLWWVCL